jgi:hypothetical protein
MEEEEEEEEEEVVGQQQGEKYDNKDCWNWVLDLREKSQ